MANPGGEAPKSEDSCIERGLERVGFVIGSHPGKFVIASLVFGVFCGSGMMALRPSGSRSAARADVRHRLQKIKGPGQLSAAAK